VPPTARVIWMRAGPCLPPDHRSSGRILALPAVDTVSLDAGPRGLHRSRVRLSPALTSALFLCACCACAAVPLAAQQCPDGTPPPCAPVRAAPRPDRALRAADSATVLVVPLSPVGTDPALRRLAATFAAVVAENMTVGEVRARVAENLSSIVPDRRPRAAARQGAGAIVDGSLIRIGGNVRAAMRLADARTGRDLASITVAGNPDSLLALADRASLSLLTEWWKRQRGPYHRSGVATISLPALRDYIEAMALWRSGRAEWRALLDSAVRWDPDFVAAWTWLALPDVGSQSLEYRWPDAGTSAPEPVGRTTPDSARRVLHAIDLRRPEPGQDAASFYLRTLPLQLAAGSFPPPSAEQPEPLGLLAVLPSPGTVEERYVAALAARISTLSGGSAGAALQRARDVVALDSTFVPGWDLLARELIDLGDTAAARPIAARLAASDSRVAGRFRTVAAARLAPAAVLQAEANRDLLDAAALLAPYWHRLRILHELAPQLPGLFAAAELGQPMSAGIAASMRVPALLALGMADSVRATIPWLVQAARQLGLLPSDTMNRPFDEMAMSPALPPDTAFVRARPSAAALDALLRSVRLGVLGSQASPSVRLAESAARTRIIRGAWITGVLGIQTGDRSAADRGAAILDSLAVTDTLGVLPLALGLRAERALAADSGAAAESLLVKAIGTSVTRCPARYRFLLAQRYAATGQLDLARRLAHSITMPSLLHGLEHVAYYAPALKLEGEMLERLGRRDEAIAVYQAFVELRADADAPLQGEVRDARQRLAALRRAR